ncbi:MAG: hypothetical protein HY066_05515 [Betaproteobacteria bacterium]|nr:hypothetical protein [Betaproteobacteria bacterium]
MSRQLPAAGLGILGKAMMTLARKARPLEVDMHRSFSVPALDGQHVARYRTFVGFIDDATVPLSYFYLLAQRAQLAAMLDPEFSFSVPGMVHVENDLRILNAIDPALPFDLDVLAIQETPSQNGKLYVVLKVLFKQAGMERVVCISRYLAHRGKGGAARQAREPNHEANHEPVTSWSLPADIGRHYAKLSGDFNPIHLWPWSARLLGFRRPIAHGMYSVAKAQAALEADGVGKITRLSARFIKPVTLPGEVFLARSTDSYCITSAGQGAVTGSFEARTDNE